MLFIRFVLLPPADFYRLVEEQDAGSPLDKTDGPYRTVSLASVWMGDE